MKLKGSDSKEHSSDHTGLLAFIVALAGFVSVVATIELSREKALHFVVLHRDRLLAAEIALFGIIIVELVGRTMVSRFRERDALHTGVTVRGVLRVVGYTVLGFSAVTILASEPTLAIGIGSVTGIIIGLGAQGLIGNVIAGMFLAIARPFRIGDTISIMGTTGKVMEIGVIYIIVDSGDQRIFIPNTAAMGNPLQRKKKGNGEPEPHV
jgi:small-conductance mechanosensitive channel